MASYQPVQFTSPRYDYGADLSQIERRRQMAILLQQQGMQPVQEQPVGPGQFAVPTSPWQDAAKLGQIYAGLRQQKKADTQQRELATRAQQDYSAMLAKGMGYLTGKPATPMVEDASSNITPAQPAVAPDYAKALEAFGSHPMGQAFVPLAMEEMKRQRMAEALRGPQTAPAAPSGIPPQPAYGSPGFAPTQGAPQAQMRTGGPAGGLPMEAWLAADPSGQKYMEQLAKDYTEANKPLVERGFGIKRLNPLTGKYELASNPEDITRIKEAELAATQPFEPPITLKTSSGQDIQLSRPEWAEYQRTGELPARLGGKPRQTGQGGIPNLAQQAGAQASGGYRVPGAPGLGTIGAGQTQQDIIQQARQQAGGKAVDEQFAKDYATFVQGGAQDSAKQLSQLQDVVKALRAPNANLTGPTLGNVPNAALNYVNPKSVEMRERVEEVVQRSLRAILGAQFTEKEGERLIARAYNPRLPESENAVRVQRLFTQLNQAFEQKKAAAQYFERNGTLEGWKGKLPNIADFDPDVGTGASKADPLGIRGK